MHQAVDRVELLRMGPSPEGGRGTFPYTHPDQLKDHLFIVVHDMDGTAVHSYDTMLIPHFVASDLPQLVSLALAGQYTNMREAEQAQMCVSEFFNQLFDGKRKGSPLNRIEYYYQQVVSHGVTLHEPEKALGIVLETTISDFKTFAEQKGIAFPALAEQQVRDGMSALLSDKYAHHISIAHSFYEGFSDWQRYCQEEMAENAVFTNTKAVFTLNKLLRTSDTHTGQRLNTDAVRLIFAQEDDSVKIGGVKYDGTAEDGQRLIAWLRKNDYVPTESMQADLYVKEALALHKHMRVYTGNKPNGVPIKRIIEELGPDIEARINAGLESRDYKGPPFKLTWRNVLMNGESPSDFGCIADIKHDEAEVKTPGYYQRLKIKLDAGEIPRLAHFAWQASGTLQHRLVVGKGGIDHVVRGSEHPHLARLHACQHEHDMAGVADIVLHRGFASLLDAAARCNIKVGLSCAPASLTPDLVRLRDADPEAWRPQMLARWHANGGYVNGSVSAAGTPCVTCG